MPGGTHTEATQGKDPAAALPKIIIPSGSCLCPREATASAPVGQLPLPTRGSFTPTRGSLHPCEAVSIAPWGSSMGGVTDAAPPRPPKGPGSRARCGPLTHVDRGQEAAAWGGSPAHWHAAAPRRRSRLAPWGGGALPQRWRPALGFDGLWGQATPQACRRRQQSQCGVWGGRPHPANAAPLTTLRCCCCPGNTLWRQPIQKCYCTRAPGAARGPGEARDAASMPFDQRCIAPTAPRFDSGANSPSALAKK